MGGGKGGGGGGGSGDLRFPPYLESMHKAFLSGNDGYNLVEAFKIAWEDNPYTGRENIDPNKGFLGTGYTIDQFPSLFDMFGKFMAGLDVEYLWSQIYEETIQGPEANDLIDVFEQETRDRRDQQSLPMLHAGMRDIGAVNSSAFVVGRAMIETARQKEITKFSAQTKMQLFHLSQERWSQHLNWNSTVISTYYEMMKVYYAVDMDADQLNYKYKESDATWELGLFDHARSMIGALTGTPAAARRKEPSDVAKAIGGMASGAAAGMGMGGPVGAGIGAVLGLATSFF